MSRPIRPSTRLHGGRFLAGLLVGPLVVASCGISAVGSGPDPDQPDQQAMIDGAADVQTNARGDGSQPVDGATDAGDASRVDAADGGVDPYSSRVSAGLIALYEFEENAGTTVADEIAPAYGLTITDPSNVTWHPHYLEITNYTSLTNAATFAKLVTRVQPTHEITVEAWVKITSIVGGGSANYGRLVSIIQDASNRDIDMGQKGTSLWAAVASASTQIEKGPAPTALSHVVVTRTASDQTLRMYVDGALFASAGGVGDPASFTPYRMFVANSFNADRGITGELHLLAFYDVALSAASVARNHGAGADPKD